MWNIANWEVWHYLISFDKKSIFPPPFLWNIHHLTEKEKETCCWRINHLAAYGNETDNIFPAAHWDSDHKDFDIYDWRVWPDVVEASSQQSAGVLQELALIIVQKRFHVI